jgi:4-hydroxybenzoyl-CoA thioesterase
VPVWRELVKTTGIIGTPILELSIQFKMAATYGEHIQVHTSIQEWRDKVFIQKHRIMRADTLLCEGLETRAFCIKHPDNPDRIKAIPIPADIKALCS